MPIKRLEALSFASYYIEKRKTKHVFLKQIEALIHWEAVNHLLAQ